MSFLSRLLTDIPTSHIAILQLNLKSWFRDAMIMEGIFFYQFYYLILNTEISK